MAEVEETASVPAAVLAPWVREVSRFWTAKADDSCPAPRSDDYADWSLAQLKREIAQRQLRIDPKRRNKDAFVRLLLADDEVEVADDAAGDEAAAHGSAQTIQPSAQEVVDVCDDDDDDDAVLTVQHQPRGRPQKRRKKSAPTTDAGSLHATDAADSTGPRPMEYLRHKLSIQAARIDIETRRLDLEVKREQRSAELHAVQLALAEEQLKQARLSTQKIRTEWVVDQMLQKKRLRDAGISADEASTLGLF